MGAARADGLSKDSGNGLTDGGGGVSLFWQKRREETLGECVWLTWPTSQTERHHLAKLITTRHTPLIIDNEFHKR